MVPNTDLPCLQNRCGSVLHLHKERCSLSFILKYEAPRNKNQTKPQGALLLEMLVQREKKYSKCSTQWSLPLGLEIKEAIGIDADCSELEVMLR